MSTFTKRQIRPIVIERGTLLTWFDTNYLMHRQLSCFGNSTFETLNHKSAGKILTTVYIVQIPYILILCGYHCHGGLLVVESVNSVVVKSCLIARNHLVVEVAICLIWFNMVGPFCGLWGFKYFERLHATEW